MMKYLKNSRLICVLKTDKRGYMNNVYKYIRSIIILINCAICARIGSIKRRSADYLRGSSLILLCIIYIVILDSKPKKIWFIAFAT